MEKIESEDNLLVARAKINRNFDLLVKGSRNEELVDLPAPHLL